MKIAICDDDEEFLNITCSMLDKWAEKRGIEVTIYRFTNGDTLLLTLKDQCIDLIFLDIVMPLLNGLEAARELRNNYQMVPIIFLTSSREFAVESYEVKALNYLLKPVEEEKLSAVLDDFYKSLEKDKEVFVAQTAMGFCKIDVADVDHLEAQNKQVNVYLSNGTIVKIRELFSKCEEFFSLERGFFKCHRSYIVNLNHVTNFTRTQVNTSTFAAVPISRNSYNVFKEAYLKYMFRS